MKLLAAAIKLFKSFYIIILKQFELSFRPY